MGHST